MDGQRRRITIAILALGGQGGGVLADWLVSTGERNGYFVQATSVPGVAQRTGSTVYYLEFFPESDFQERQPVLALMPAPGDVDVVIASELMEAGRAILRGFVMRERTTLVTSTHRVYAISEKSAVSDGLANSAKVLAAAVDNAMMLVAFNMEGVSAHTGSAISAVMLGGVAASGALPFSRAQFEMTIRASGIAVEANLAGFSAGLEAALRGGETQTRTPGMLPEPATEGGRQLRDRVVSELPPAAHDFALEGVRRLMDYQDKAYAKLYLDRLAAISALDGDDWALTREAARSLALWMSYEDVMRVAQQKARASRMDKVRAEVNAQPDQILYVTEYMHPRWQELCDTMPAKLGARLERGGVLKRIVSPWLEKGHHVRTTGIGWFLVLSFLASRKGARRKTLRYAVENARIESWLEAIMEAVKSDREIALELVRAQNLIKGYGETHNRGIRKFSALIEAYRRLQGTPDTADTLRKLRLALLEDQDGTSLNDAL